MPTYGDLIPKAPSGVEPPKKEGFLKRAARAVLPQGIETKLFGEAPPAPVKEAAAKPSVRAGSIYSDLVPGAEGKPEAPKKTIYSDLVPDRGIYGDLAKPKKEPEPLVTPEAVAKFSDENVQRLEKSISDVRGRLA